MGYIPATFIYLVHKFFVLSILGSTIPAEVLTAKDFPAASTVYTATFSDTENDDITTLMTSCEPSATCPFTLAPSTKISAINFLNIYIYMYTFLSDFCITECFHLH